MGCPGCKRTTWFKWTEKCYSAFDLRLSATREDFKRNHMDKWSPLLVQSWLARWQSFSYGLIQVGSDCLQLHSSPTEPNISPYAHMLNAIYLCSCSPRKVNWRFPVKRGRRGGECGRKISEEEERQVEANKTPPSVVKTKMLKCKIPPPPLKKWKETKLHGEFSPRRDARDESSSPTITHSVHVLSASQTKASLIQSALSCEGEGHGKGCNWGQHVGWCSMSEF